MSKHYIRVDEFNNIIKAFSNNFVVPEEDDICIDENGDRQFDLEIFHYLNNEIFTYKYKYEENNIVLKTQEELDEDYNKVDIKKKIINLIRVKILNASNWINGVWTAQEHGHSVGINTHPKGLTVGLYNQWTIWFESVFFILSDIDLETIDYKDIHLNNQTIFKPMPDFPGDIMNHFFV